MEIEIATAEELQVTDADIQALLTQVYVEGGYTSAEDAVTMFDPAAVRQRGVLLAACEKPQAKLAGMIILVPPHSPARRMAQNNEAEIHLLGVSPEYRGRGIGRKLIEAAITRARYSGFTKLILWTQPAMLAAQQLYESTGFMHVSNFERGSRTFKLYEKKLGV